MPQGRAGTAPASMLVGALALAALALMLSADARVAAAAGARLCTASNVCATVADRPDAVSASSATTVRHVGLDTSLTNDSGNQLSLVQFRLAIPAGFTFVKDTLDACNAAAGTVTCQHGSVVDDQTVSNTLVFQTPVLALGTTQASTFAGRWCWAGCNSHNPGAARVDAIDVPETTTVKAVKGFDATYLPAGTPADLSTGSTVSDTDTLSGTWAIPGQANDLAATATEQPNPTGFKACPSDGKRCRSGSWFGALSPGTTSFSPAGTVVYTQNKSVIPPGTTPSNYEVVYTPCLPGCEAVRLPRCTSASDLRCTEFVTKLPGGNYRVGVRIGSHNGFMM